MSLPKRLQDSSEASRRVLRSVLTPRCGASDRSAPAAQDSITFLTALASASATVAAATAAISEATSKEAVGTG